MPEFVPILLLALVVLVGLYLGFSSAFSLPSATGFATASPSVGKQQSPQMEIPFFTQTKIKNEIFLGNGFTISAVNKTEITVFGGTLDTNTPGASQISNDFFNLEGTDRVQGVLRISRTTSGGDIAVFINNQEVYRGAPKVGKYTFEVDTGILEYENTIRVETSAGFLSSSSYDFDFRLYGLYGSHAKYRFFLKDTSDRKLEMSFSNNYGWLKVLLNGNEVFYGKPEDFISVEIPQNFFSEKGNVLEVLPEFESSFYVDFVEISKK